MIKLMMLPLRGQMGLRRDTQKTKNCSRRQKNAILEIIKKGEEKKSRQDLHSEVLNEKYYQKQGKEKKSYEKDEKNCKSYLNRDYGAGDGSAEFC